MDRLRCGFSLALAVAMLSLTDAASGASAQEMLARGPVTNLPMPRFVSIRADHANARRGPGLDYRIDWEFVRRGLPVKVIAEHGQWRKVQDAEGYGGWVHQSLISGVRTGLVSGEKNVPMLADPEAGADVRAEAEPGALLQLETCVGDWCEVRAGGHEGWLERSALWGVRADEEFD